MAGLLDFKIALNSFKETTVEQHRQLCGKIALDTLKRVVDKSPVDRGRFRAAWTLAEGQADLTVPEDGKDSYAPPDLMQAASIAGGVDAFPTIVLANNVEYAEELERGHSQQAPGGVLGVAVAEIAEKFR